MSPKIAIYKTSAIVPLATGSIGEMHSVSDKNDLNGTTKETNDVTDEHTNPDDNNETGIKNKTFPNINFSFMLHKNLQLHISGLVFIKL